MADTLGALWRKLPNLESFLPTKEPQQVPRAIQRPTDKHISDIVAEYREGATIRQLAIKHRIGRETVSKILKQSGVTMRRTGLTPEQVEEAVRLYTKGWSLAKIGNRFSVDGKTVWSRLTDRGVRMREPYERTS
ncbi:lambda repressor-like predicted transcriptional regulator [Lipingzhangella halophila]|uniref:Lambda repressor-like predicted transcriptional regulator n=1 Tax=Lipingzhangella halophila TaxID=1783352 RepID=A0A7W7RE86_9ACTN|nr:hypothetical protein [Lipingzhangella halophila]MBB4930382.1 lambda repressor-like predicted transcriptional regulator [Lipingzhangella halophila]